MKKPSILLLLFCLSIVFRAAAQERNVVQGVCKDENGKAIENVSVYAHDSLLVAITDHETLVFDTEGNVLERYPQGQNHRKALYQVRIE